MGEHYSFNMDPPGSQQHSRRPGCCGRRTGLEKCCAVLNAFLFIALAIVGAVAYFLFAYQQTLQPNAPHAAHLISVDSNASSDAATESPARHCLTPGCVHAAATVLRLLDDTVAPCDDFYGFACGSFVRDTAIPADQAGVNIFSEIVDTLQVQIRGLLLKNGDDDEWDANGNSSNESRPVRLARDFHAACLNQTRIEELGVQPQLDLLKRFGGWPVLQADDAAAAAAWDADDSWSWVEATKRFAESGISTSYIFSLTVQTDLLNSSVRTLDLDQTWLGIDREYLVEGLNDTIVRAYYAYMVDVAVALGAQRPQAERELRTALEFEIELAAIGLPKEERRNATALHNPMQLHAIQAAYPFVDWLDYVNALLPTGDGIVATDNETIVVTVPAFFANLTDLLGRTPKRTVANYLLWRAVEQTVNYAPDRLRDLLHAFEKVQSGQEEKTARWQECIDRTSENLPISLAALYVRRHFRDSAKQAADSMVRSIRAEFAAILAAVPWMDEETRRAALHKLDAMHAHIGYPPELADDRLLRAHYRDLDVAADRYLESALRVQRFETEREFLQLRQPVNKTDWVRHANVATLNALYRPTENSIIFPAGILQGRFFAAERPAYLNYGAIGFVIGHEITHGFDTKGRQFDGLGNVNAWWRPQTLDRFLERTACLEQQFGNYTEPRTQLAVNGERTLGENIADSGGVRIAYRAYRNWALARGAAEAPLPGLPYTAEQLFWVSAAQNWCSVSTKESLSWAVTTDQHAPDVFRVLGALQNSAEFARDFGCAAGAPMNPAVKCGLW